MSNIERTLTDRVRRAIVSAGLPQAEIARRSGVSEAQISRFVHSRQSITLRTLDKILSAVEIEIP